MLRNSDDLDFSSKENLIGSVRREREQRQSSDQNSVGNENSGRTSRQSNGGTNSTSGTATVERRGNDEEVDSGNGSSGGFGQNVGDLVERNARGYGSSYQSVQPPEQGYGFRDRVRSTANKYREALREEKKESEKKKRPEGRKLTDAEAIRIRPALIEYVLWQSEHLDQLIIATTGGHDPTIEIWSNITEPEAEILVDFFISQAKIYPKVAQAVRVASVAIERLKVGIIIAPRVYQTIMTYGARGFTIR